MIDIHCHIIPGVDDGASDFAESISMGETAVSCGVTDIIVTPHCNVPGSYTNYNGEAYEREFKALQALFQENGVKLRLHRGMEVFATDDIADRYTNGEIITLANSRYMLVEFDFEDDAWRARDVLLSLKSCGVTPIIAHPERYSMVQYDMQFAIDWANMGCLLQINRTSICSRMSIAAYTAARTLLENGAVHFIATDAHGVFARTTELIEAYDYVAERYSEEWANILMIENPQRVLQNKRIRRLPME